MTDAHPARARTRRAKPRPDRRRRRAAVMLVVVGAVIAASGTWAAWQSSGSLSQSVSSATVTVDLVEGGSGAATWTTPITDLVPGDYFYRYATLTNTGSLAQTFSGTLGGTATLPGALTAWVSSCSQAFTGTTCGGTSADLLGTSASPAAFGALASLGSVAASGTKYIQVKVVFSASADVSTYQNQASTITLSVSGTAGGGADRTNG